jgi:hypothetical protein
MNHQPFEGWLLDNTSLTLEQKNELDAHTRICAYCAALVKTEKLLSAPRMISPADGFVDRFQVRFVVRKAENRKRRIIGSLLFALGGLALMLWIASPYLLTFMASPASWITTFVEWGVFLLTTFDAAAQAGSVILDVLSGLLPPFAWMVLASFFAGVSLLWSVSIWRFARWGVPQGV